MRIPDEYMTDAFRDRMRYWARQKLVEFGVPISLQRGRDEDGALPEVAKACGYIVQDVYEKLLESPEPEEPIKYWPAYLRAWVYRRAMEVRRHAWSRREVSTAVDEGVAAVIERRSDKSEWADPEQNIKEEAATAREREFETVMERMLSKIRGEVEARVARLPRASARLAECTFEVFRRRLQDPRRSLSKIYDEVSTTCGEVVSRPTLFRWWAQILVELGDDLRAEQERIARLGL